MDEQVWVGGVGPTPLPVVQVSRHACPDRFGERHDDVGQVEPANSDICELKLEQLPYPDGVERQQPGQCRSAATRGDTDDWIDL